MSPPGGNAVTRPSGGSTGTEATSQTELRIRAAHSVLAHCDIEMSPRKVNRLVRRFEARVQRNGWSFFEFFTNAIRLTDDQRRRALCDPDLARIFRYADDPTGEDAVANVMRADGGY